MFVIQIKIDDERNLHGAVVEGTMYWKAMQIVSLMGYRANSEIIRLYVGDVIRMSNLVPRDQNTSCVIPKQAKMITNDQVFSLAIKVKKPCEEFVILFSKILTQPLRADPKRDIHHLIRYPELTCKDPAVMYIEPNGGIFLKDLIAKTKNCERIALNPEECSGTLTGIHSPETGDDKMVGIKFCGENSIPSYFIVMTMKNRKIR
ncbi:hypothetical protein AVEN_216807-1, partial [Araneus ventricosus]